MKLIRIVAVIVLVLFAAYALAAPQTTAFTYQGRLLQNGTPTNGNHNLSFTLWDAASGGSQIGPAISQSGYPVANGVFTIDLDFGSNVFNGAQRWLNVVIDGNALTPRQPINSSPVAQFALSGANGISVTASASGQQFNDDRLYAGVALTGQNLPMVMLQLPAFSPAGATTRPGYAGGVDVFSLTSATELIVSSGGGGGGTVARAQARDYRMLVALDPAYPGIATSLYQGTHRQKLQIDVLQSPTSNVVIQSYCYGDVLFTVLQPMPQSGVYEATISAAQIGTRIAQVNSSGTVTGYTQSGWNFTTNSTFTAPCITATP